MVLLEVGQVLRRQPRGTGKWKVESGKHDDEMQ